MAKDLFRIDKGLSLRPQASEPANPQDGDVFFDNTLGVFRFYQNGTWNTLGEGGGGVGSKNYLESQNSTFDVQDTDFAVYNDGGATPTDLTGGTASGNLTVSTTDVVGEVLAGDKSLKLSKAAFDTQGEGISVLTKNIDSIDRGKTFLLSIDKNTSANYANGDLEVYAYDVTNSKFLVIIASEKEMLAGKGNQQFLFITENNTESVRIGFHVATTNALAYDVFLDQLLFTPAPEIKLPVERKEIIDLTGSGDFTAGEILVTKNQSLVTVTLTQIATHAALPTPASAAGLIPDWAIPANPKANTYEVSGAGVSEMKIEADGTLGFEYRDYAGSGISNTSSGNSASISYALESTDANTTEALAINGGLATDSATQTNSTMAASGNYLVGASYTLRAGKKYEVKGVISYGNNGSNPAYTSLGTRWCIANGANNSTPPSLLVNNLNGNIIWGLLGDSKIVSTSNSFGSLDAPSFTIQVINDITIYLVPTALASSPANARVSSEIAVQEVPFSQTAIVGFPGPAARYTSSSGQAIAVGGTVLKYEEEDFDTDSAYNATTGEYTVKKRGIYDVFASYTYTSSISTSILAILVNGTIKRRSFFFMSDDHNFSLQTSSKLLLEEGDIVTIQANSNSTRPMTTTSSENEFSIAMIRRP